MCPARGAVSRCPTALGTVFSWTSRCSALSFPIFLVLFLFLLADASLGGHDMLSYFFLLLSSVWLHDMLGMRSAGAKWPSVLGFLSACVFEFLRGHVRVAFSGRRIACTVLEVQNRCMRGCAWLARRISRHDIERLTYTGRSAHRFIAQDFGVRRGVSEWAQAGRESSLGLKRRLVEASLVVFLLPQTTEIKTPSTLKSSLGHLHAQAYVIVHHHPPEASGPPQTGVLERPRRRCTRSF